MRSAVFVLLALTPSPARAGVVLAFDGARCYSGAVQYWLTGNGMPGPYQQLLAAGHTVVTTSLLTPEVLQGVDVFVSGALIPGTALAQSEVDALAAWIAAGGGAHLMGEGNANQPANVQYGALCGGVAYLGEYVAFDVALTITAPGHPLIQGPAGTVAVLQGMNVPGRWGSTPANVTRVAENPDASGALLAAQVGAGRIVLLNDVVYCAHPPTYIPSHAILWDNAIAWLMTPSGPGTVFCSGDGSAAACPCGNFGASGEGCASSLGIGAILDAVGAASIAADTLVLEGSQMPNAPALYFQGTQQLAGGAGVAFGDGLRCAAGTITRLGTKQNAAGASSYPVAGDLSVSVRGNCAAGDVRQYQVWYRNSAAFCTPSGFNLSNGYEVAWGA